KKIKLLALCAMLFALCSFTQAQQAGKVFRIGFLDPSAAAGSAVLVEAFRQCHRALKFIISTKYEKARDTQGRGPQARPSLTAADPGRQCTRRPPTDRAQACGSGTEA